MRKLRYFLLLWLCSSVSMQAGSNIMVIPLQALMPLYPAIQYQKCFDTVAFSCKEKFPLIPRLPHQGNFLETFILTLPNARIQTSLGFILFENHFIYELLWGGRLELLSHVRQMQDHEVYKFSGRVAVIANVAGDTYAHWLDEVLGRLALLEMYNISYDWLYVCYEKPFMQETLQLWGVDPAKIIQVPCDSRTFSVQADEVIVPSTVIATDLGYKKHIGLYVHPYTAEYVRNKLLCAAKAQNRLVNFSKRVFISRKDAPWRKMINEDQVFKIFEKYGFERYEPSKLSVVDQILLFENAEIVVATHGSALINTMFCKPGTHVIEIFQALIDSSFWYIAHLFNLEYIAIKTLNFKEEHVTNWPAHTKEYDFAWRQDTYIPLHAITQTIFDVIKRKELVL
jgi:capsular polysaccharide biosynthesis protein